MAIPSSRSLIFEVKSTGSELAFGRLRQTSDVFGSLRTSSGIFGNDRVVFKNPSTPRIKISRLYLRKSWQVYISLRLVLFFPFRCCFASSPQFSLSTVKQTKLFHSIYEMFFTFLTRKNSLRKTFLLECVRSGAQQAARKGGNFGAKLTHLCGF